MADIIQQVKTTKTNNITGEIVETEKEQIIRYPKTADFVMSFTKDLGYMKNLSKAEILVTFGLLQIVNRNNEIILNKGIKNRIANEFGLKQGSMDQLISNLKRKKIIQSIKTPEGKNLRGVYLLNTFLFGKGNWMNIKKQRMYIEWDFQKKIKRTIVEQDYLSDEEIEELETKRQKELQKQFLEMQKLEEEQNLKQENSLFK